MAVRSDFQPNADQIEALRHRRRLRSAEESASATRAANRQPRPHERRVADAFVYAVFRVFAKLAPRLRTDLPNFGKLQNEQIAKLFQYKHRAELSEDLFSEN